MVYYQLPVEFVLRVHRVSMHVTGTSNRLGVGSIYVIFIEFRVIVKYNDITVHIENMIIFFDSKIFILI